MNTILLLELAGLEKREGKRWVVSPGIAQLRTNQEPLEVMFSLNKDIESLCLQTALTG